MNRQEIVSFLKQHIEDLKAKYQIVRLGLFGSAARDDAQTGSDLDFLVEFNGPATSRQYFDLLFWLEDNLGKPIDLVTTKALRPELKPFIERDLIDV